MKLPAEALRDGEGLVGEEDRGVGHLPKCFVDLLREVARCSEPVTVNQVQQQEEPQR